MYGLLPQDNKCKAKKQLTEAYHILRQFLKFSVIISEII